MANNIMWSWSNHLEFHFLWHLLPYEYIGIKFAVIIDNKHRLVELAKKEMGGNTCLEN